jgi:hypothetical protein
MIRWLIDIARDWWAEKRSTDVECRCADCGAELGYLAAEYADQTWVCIGCADARGITGLGTIRTQPVFVPRAGSA